MDGTEAAEAAAAAEASAGAGAAGAAAAAVAVAGARAASYTATKKVTARRWTVDGTEEAAAEAAEVAGAGAGVGAVTRSGSSSTRWPGGGQGAGVMPPSILRARSSHLSARLPDVTRSMRSSSLVSLGPIMPAHPPPPETPLHLPPPMASPVHNHWSTR